jgi:hypothetical protein
MYDIAKQEFDELLHTSTKCNLYQYRIPTFYIQTYLTKPIPKLYKKCIIKMRLSSHNLAIPKLHNCFTFLMLNNCNNLKTDGFLQ